MDSRRRIGRSAALWLIAIAPVLLLAAGVVRFMLNHMFYRGPYLLDTGMLSALVYRDGLLMPTPQIACNYATVFYDVYVSPLMSLFSALSYLAPTDRLEWFAVVEAAVFAPVGFAVYVVASRLEPDSLLRRLPITLFAALAFSFSGIVLWMIGYPHLEAAIPALTCLTLGALVNGRTRMAWLGLVLAASVRQDGGAHVAIAIAPLLVVRWRGVAMAPSRRRLIAMICAGIAACIAGMVCQKLFFHPAGRLRRAGRARRRSAGDAGDRARWGADGVRGRRQGRARAPAPVRRRWPDDADLVPLRIAHRDAADRHRHADPAAPGRRDRAAVIRYAVVVCASEVP